MGVEKQYRFHLAEHENSIGRQSLSCSLSRTMAPRAIGLLVSKHILTMLGRTRNMRDAYTGQGELQNVRKIGHQFMSNPCQGSNPEMRSRLSCVRACMRVYLCVCACGRAAQSLSAEWTRQIYQDLEAQKTARSKKRIGGRTRRHQDKKGEGQGKR
eukprot:362721-Chlamydomonas_euryale.AAC.14